VQVHARGRGRAVEDRADLVEPQSRPVAQREQVLLVRSQFPSPDIFVSTDPTGGRKACRLSAIDRTLGTITGVACRANTSSCVAVDNAGNVIASG
jgi:hypothetical protein